LVNKKVSRLFEEGSKQNLFFEDNFYNSNKTRPSLMNQSKIKGSYGYINQLIIDPYTSDEESFDEDFNHLPAIEPSVPHVCEYLFDINTLMTIDVKNNIYNF
jgi:hypothetical protein